MKNAKKTCFVLLLSVLLLLTCALPALAGYEYGPVYDGTERMQENALRAVGDVLTEISDSNGVECRVDIVSTLQGYSLEDYAEGLYETYDYGKDYANGGLLLLLYLKPDSTGFELGGYEVYYGGRAYTDLEAAVESAMNGRITEFAWSYAEELDRAAVNDALIVYTDAVGAYFGENTDTAAAISAAAAGAASDLVVETPDATAADGAASAATSAQLDYVTDEAGLLSSDQLAALNQKAREMSEKYNCGVYIVTVDDFQRYTSGSVEDCSRGFFNSYDLGYGSTKDGVLLLLSMADRDYDLIAHGDLGNAAFTDYGKTQMENSFLRYFARDDWYGGFDDYLGTAEEYLDMAVNGQPYDTYDDGPSEGASKAGRTGIVLGVPTVVAGLVNRVQSRKMKSVRRHTSAGSYAAASGLIMKDTKDVYTHSTESRTRIAPVVSNNNHRGTGGGTTIGHGGFSGHSGKF
ncbi:MAG: TPM domain-containing protein [Firmicutes bacterium]|nr:TPM domain-containing protein [Bacillota bacterium]